MFLRFQPESKTLASSGLKLADLFEPIYNIRSVPDLKLLKGQNMSKRGLQKILMILDQFWQELNNLTYIIETISLTLYILSTRFYNLPVEKQVYV